MSSRMRVTKGHTRNRRSHHGIEAPRLSMCDNCKDYHLRHRMCGSCGSYKGRTIKQPKVKTPAVAEAETK